MDLAEAEQEPLAEQQQPQAAHQALQLGDRDHSLRCERDQPPLSIANLAEEEFV